MANTNQENKKINISSQHERSWVASLTRSSSLNRCAQRKQKAGLNALSAAAANLPFLHIWFRREPGRVNYSNNRPITKLYQRHEINTKPVLYEAMLLAGSIAYVGGRKVHVSGTTKNDDANKSSITWLYGWSRKASTSWTPCDDVSGVLDICCARSTSRRQHPLFKDCLRSYGRSHSLRSAQAAQAATRHSWTSQHEQHQWLVNRKSREQRRASSSCTKHNARA